MADFPAPKRPLWRVALPVAGAAVLALAGCGGDSGPSKEELENMVAPDDISGDAANDPELSELRFDAETVACEPHANSGVAGAWQTSAPRKKLSGDDQAELGLRDTEETEDLAIVAQVLTPDDERFDAESAASGGEWATVAYPEDFPDAPDSLTNGSYTVIWTSSDGDEDAGTFISCDGFRAG